MEHTYDFYPGAYLNTYGLEINREQTGWVVASDDGFRLYDTKECKLRQHIKFKHALQFANVQQLGNIYAVTGRRETGDEWIDKDRISVWNLGGSNKDPHENFMFTIQDDRDVKVMRILFSTVANRLFTPICHKSITLLRMFKHPDPWRPESIIAGWKTCPNPHGLAVLGQRYLIMPGISEGKLQNYHIASKKLSLVNAHNSALRAIAMSQDEEYIATCSVTGTLVRLWSTRDLSKLAEYRRGLDESDVYDLAFSPDNSFLALTSDKGTLHIFELPFGGNALPVYSVQASSEKSRPTYDHQRNPSLNSTTSASINIPHQRRSSNPINQPSSSSPRAFNYSQISGTGGDSSPSSGLVNTTDRTGTTPPLEPRDSVSNAGSPGTISSFATSHATAHAQSRRKLSTGAPKSARFVDPLPSVTTTTPGSTLRRGHSPRFEETIEGDYYDAGSIAGISTISSTGTVRASGNSATNAPSGAKYGVISNLPFIPRVLRDTYSSTCISFYLAGVSSSRLHPTKEATALAAQMATAKDSYQPGASTSSMRSSSSGKKIPSAPQGAALTSKQRRKLSLLAGDPPVGKLAWSDATHVLVISAKRGGEHQGGLWEKFRLGRRNRTGELCIEFEDWKMCPGNRWESTEAEVGPRIENNTKIIWEWDAKYEKPPHMNGLDTS